MASATTVTRLQLSQLTSLAGAPMRVDADGSPVLLHIANAATATDHVYISAHNVGSAPVRMRVTVSAAASSSFDLTVPAGIARGTRLIVPGLPLYDSASTASISVSIAGSRWTNVTTSAPPITLANIAFDAVTGSVGAVTTGGIVPPGLDAPPLLVVVEDKTRDADPHNKSKGQSASIELVVNATTGAVTATILEAGAGLTQANARVRVASHILVLGYVLREQP